MWLHCEASGLGRQERGRREALIHLRVHQSFHWRLTFLVVFFLSLAGTVVIRVFTLAIAEHRRFVIAAERQHQFLAVLPSVRGTIFMQDKFKALQTVAVEKKFFTLVAVPKDITDPVGAAEALEKILPEKNTDVFAKISKSQDPYEILAKKLDARTSDKIRSLRITGLELVEESRRVYPYGAFASSLIGFVSYRDGEERGEYGLEKEYHSSLQGERGFFSGEKDATGYWLAIGKRILNPPINGDNIILTVDANIQFKVEDALSRLREQWGGELATAIVLEPKTGRILALSAHPTFDPNAYSKEKDFSRFRMPVIDSQFELGSVFKPITLAAGIDAGVVSATTTYQDPGTIYFKTYSVSNFDGKSHGIQTMTQVLEKSLNTGAAFVAGRLGQDRFLDAIRRFGFGATSGIDFGGEISGDISHLGAGRAIDYATASFGQGIAVTPLQMATAIASLANHGMLMRPYLVEKIIDASGNEEMRHPQEIHRVVTPQTAETISQMLVSVVRNGFDNHAGVTGYFVAGKTGTAQIPLKDGRGYSDDAIHTFVGYAPAFDPRFLILLQLNKPQGVRFASTSLTPTFHSLAQFILNYYDIPPEER